MVKYLVDMSFYVARKAHSTSLHYTTDNVAAFFRERKKAACVRGHGNVRCPYSPFYILHGYL